MNAQSNHPINDTTDSLFLGPEAGQQAGVKATRGANWMQTARSCIATFRSHVAP